jgi:hypothetical protein
MASSSRGGVLGDRVATPPRTVVERGRALSLGSTIGSTARTAALSPMTAHIVNSGRCDRVKEPI